MTVEGFPEYVDSDNAEDFIKTIEKVFVTNKSALENECSNSLIVKTKEEFHEYLDTDNVEDFTKPIEKVELTNKIALEKECSNSLIVKTEEGFPECLDSHNAEDISKPIEKAGGTNKIALEKECSNSLIVKTEEGFPEESIKPIEQVGVTNKIALEKECSNNLIVVTVEGFPEYVDSDNAEDFIKTIEKVFVTNKSALENECSNSLIVKTKEEFHEYLDTDNVEDFTKPIEKVELTNKIALEKECSNSLIVKTEEGFPECLDSHNAEDISKPIEKVGGTNKIALEKECSNSLIVKTEEGFPECLDSDNAEDIIKPIEKVGSTNKIALEKECSNSLIVKIEEGFPDCVDINNVARHDLAACSKGVILESGGPCSDHVSSELVGACRVHVKSELLEWQDSGVGNVPSLPLDTSGLPKSALVFVEAIKRNRSYQKVIGNKLTQVQERIEEIKRLNDRVKILNDFQIGCKDRMGKALAQKKDARLQLISAMKEISSLKSNYKKETAMCYGPSENPHVDVYREVLTKFAATVTREKWSKKEIENLKKGVQLQFQEQLLKSFYILNDTDESSIEGSNFDMMVDIIKVFDMNPQNMGSFLPKINWEQLSSTYVPSRSGMECQSRWLNCEDPLINWNPWTNMEDTYLLHNVKKNGPNNWIDIARSLGTNRTPFQCLARYQRSLNASILRTEWTKEEDIKLRAAIEEYGENNWQYVASVMEGRTGVQCSNRWQKSIHPARKRVGKWTTEEDKSLKVAVTIFGAKNWHKIAELVPGRMQSQCRERWTNSLDPSLNFGGWTSKEDLLLKEAIQEHGHCWSKVASCVPHRTDNQCMRRWMMFPEQVPMHLAASKAKKTSMISNFVDRESERPAISPNDFITSLDSAGRNTNQTLKSNNKRNLLIPKCENPDNLESSDSIIAIAPKRCKLRRSKLEACSPKNHEAEEIEDMTLASFLAQPRGVKRSSQSPETVSASAEDDSTAQVDENDITVGVSRPKRPKRSGCEKETSSDRMQVNESWKDLPLSKFCKNLKRSKRVQASLH